MSHRQNPQAPRTPPLRLVFWESTSLCNLACMHCRRCDVAAELSRFDLQTHQARDLIHDLAANLDKPVLVFSGGEPLMRGDWAELGRYASELGLPIALATNGTMVDAPVAELIRQVGFARVSISLDGADAHTHDGFRRLPGSFEAALAGAAHVRQAGVELQINTTIARHNVHQLGDLHELARRLQARALHLFLLVPVGCGVEIGQSHRISPQEYEAVLHWVYERQQDSPLQLKATCAPHYFRVAAQRRAQDRQAGPAAPAAAQPHRLHAATRGCLAGISVAFVSHRGQVCPCGYLPVEAGDILDAPLSRIWRHSELFAELRDYDRLAGKCGRCGYRAVCGGCRARAAAEFGDHLAEEPMCSYQPPRCD